MMIHQESCIFQYKNHSLPISVKFSKRTTIGINVHPDKRIEVTAPFKTSILTIQKIINRRSKWIFKQLEKFEKYRWIQKITEYMGGETVWLLGQSYMVKFVRVESTKKEQIVKEKKLIKIYIHQKRSQNHINRLVQDWYNKQAVIYLSKVFEKCYQKIKKYSIEKPTCSFRYMERRWGSCTSKGKILLNPEMVQIPPQCIEYIIMHELCHLKHHNHSKEFYNFLNTVLPSWKDDSQALDSFLQI